MAGKIKIHWNKVVLWMPVMFCENMMRNCVTPQKAAMPSIESLSIGFDQVDAKLRLGERSFTNLFCLSARMQKEVMVVMRPVPERMNGRILLLISELLVGS